MELLKRIHTYWTVWVGYLAVLVGVVELHSGAITALLPDDWKGKFSLILGVAVVVTRIRRDLMGVIK